MKKRTWFLPFLAAFLVACGSGDSETAGENETEEPAAEEMEEESAEDTTEDTMDHGDHEDGEMASDDEEASDEEMGMDDGTSAEEVTGNVASPLLAKGESVTYLFSTVGTYAIHCDPHPTMKMTVVVEDGASLSGQVELMLSDYAFSEESVTVAPGTEITWTNEDSARHNVAIEVSE